MPRRPSLSSSQVEEIRNNPNTSIRDFATKFKVSHITIQMARLKRGAYAEQQEVLDTPVKSGQGLEQDLEGIKWTGFAKAE